MLQRLPVTLAQVKSGNTSENVLNEIRNALKAGFTNNTCGPFTKNKERIKKLKENGDSRYIYQNEVNKACYQHDIAYGDFKDLSRSTIADKVLHDKAFCVAKIPKGDGYQRGLASMVYKFFDKKISGGTFKNEVISNKESAEELDKPIMRKFKKTKVDSSFIDNVCGADLEDKKLISKFSKRFNLLLCAIDI